LQRIWIRVEPHLFRGSHMTNKHIEIGQAATVFAVRPTCVQCKRTLPADLREAALCAACAPRYMPERLVANLEALSLASETYANFYQTCQKCMGVTYATPITCPNSDCNVFWERRAMEQEMRRCESMLVRLAINSEATASATVVKKGELF
jgi:hypothetical protein